MTPSIPTAADIAAVVFPPIKAPDPLANQCDGCRAGIPIDAKGLHRKPDGWPHMSCQRKKYDTAVAELEANEGICAQESEE